MSAYPVSDRRNYLPGPPMYTLAFPCPTCKAPAGKYCIGNGMGTGRSFHGSRDDAGRKAEKVDLQRIRKRVRRTWRYRSGVCYCSLVPCPGITGYYGEERDQPERVK